jgi:hypothetical protein
MGMDAEIVRNWLMAINMLVSASVWLFVFLDRRQHARIETINKLEAKIVEIIGKLEAKYDAKLDDCRNRISSLEAELKSTPNRQELVRMHERIDEVFQNIQTTQLMIGELSGQIKQMNHASKP